MSKPMNTAIALPLISSYTAIIRKLQTHSKEFRFQSIRAGRLSILLQLNPGAGCIVGAEIEVKFGSVILADLAAHFFWRHEVDFGELD